jgi:hypothetical protein
MNIKKKCFKIKALNSYSSFLLGGSKNDDVIHYFIEFLLRLSKIWDPDSEIV